MDDVGYPLTAEWPADHPDATVAIPSLTISSVVSDVDGKLVTDQKLLIERESCSGGAPQAANHLFRR